MDPKVVSGWMNEGAPNALHRQARSYPPRQAARWTATEEQDMLSAVLRGATCEQIARIHQRSIGGVSTRLARLWSTYPASQYNQPKTAKYPWWPKSLRLK